MKDIIPVQDTMVMLFTLGGTPGCVQGPSGELGIEHAGHVP